MAQAREGKKDRPTHRVLMYAQTAEDVSILQDILAGIGAEGVVCTDFADLCRRTAQDADGVLLTEQSVVDGALPVLAEALESQPDWSDLPVLFVAAGGAESPLAVQAMQELRNVVILDRPVRIATLASVLRMASRTRDKQRQVRDLLQEREQRAQRLRRLTERLEEEVEAKTDSLADTIDRLHDEVAGRALAEGELERSSQMLVAERGKAFVELQERARQLQQLTLELSETEDRERKRLAEILHDDLQQLLAAAKFQVGLLGRRDGGNGELLEMVGQIKAILAEAIEKSRSLSHELSPPGLAHNNMGEAFEWLAQQMWRKHGLTVRLDIRERIELQSELLKTLLYKAAQEMLFNVIKHAGITEARVWLRRRGGHICLCVSDKGQGFDPQGPGHTGGLGLLSIRERVELLGGRVKVRSSKGRGSTFLIVVPDSQPPAARAGDHTRDQVARGSRMRERWQTSSDEHVLRVLLADDHEIVRKGIECMLVDERDIEVIGQAANGREAVDLALQLEPDVVVMDVSMPMMPGDEATRQIKRHLPQARVIALSMSEDAETVKRMHRAGADSYVLKTAPSEELLAAIRASSQ